jgi:CheY-like chemotaxis protein
MTDGKAAILVLDDDDGFRRFLVRALSAAGYRVTDTGKSNEALDLLAGNAKFDLLIADIQMPGFDPHGINVGNAALGKKDGPKVIYITGDPGHVPNGFVDRSRTPVLGKPIRADALIASVATALRARG